MKELQPLNENVLLEVTEDLTEKKTAGGIIIPDTAKEKPQMAKVVAIGNIENPGVSVGDIVVYKKYSGTELKFDGREFLFVPYADLLAKIVETESI
ncbi:MAG TPA: co-chaperone GroES [Bacteroidales bacterium]|nr:co-chaperone GroES [Bacteroidales bacterium]HPE55040.1 co-chaperone GroES [Bacteroidales bacterium]HRX97806.1 co-chaperone GroES [Bacteroidales bacterium]